MRHVYACVVDCVFVSRVCTCECVLECVYKLHGLNRILETS